MPPLKIACFWDYPSIQTSFKHRKHSSANVTSALQVKKKRKRKKIGDYSKHVPSQLSVRHGKELLVIAHLVYPPASAGMFPTIYLLQLSRLDWNVWNGESSTVRFERLHRSLWGGTGRALCLIVSLIYFIWIVLLFLFCYFHLISMMWSQATCHLLH